MSNEVGAVLERVESRITETPVDPLQQARAVAYVLANAYDRDSSPPEHCLQLARSWKADATSPTISASSAASAMSVIAEWANTQSEED